MYEPCTGNVDYSFALLPFHIFKLRHEFLLAYELEKQKIKRQLSFTVPTHDKRKGGGRRVGSEVEPDMEGWGKVVLVLFLLSCSVINWQQTN